MVSTIYDIRMFHISYSDQVIWIFSDGDGADDDDDVEDRDDDDDDDDDGNDGHDSVDRDGGNQRR